MINTKRVLIAMALFLTVALWFGLYYRFYGWQLFGYGLVSHQQNDVHLVKENERKVPSTIVDHDWHAGFFVGLRLNAEYLECKSLNRFRHAIRVSDERGYFILDVHSKELLNFSSYEEFMFKLASLDLKGKINLDLSRFDQVGSHYARVQGKGDYSNCKVLSGS